MSDNPPDEDGMPDSQSLGKPTCLPPRLPLAPPSHVSVTAVGDVALKSGHPT